MSQRVVSVRPFFKNTNRVGEPYTLDELSRLQNKEDAIWLQSTGLIDKNGREVYEKDIVKAHAFYFDGNEAEKNILGVIEFVHFSWCIVAGNDLYNFYDTSHFEEPCIEVICNFHELNNMLTNLKKDE